MARDPRLLQPSTAVRFLGAAESQQRRKGELGRYIVRFFAINSPPDQLKSVVEDCELLAEDETLMNLSLIEEVCEAAHDESLTLLPFLPPGGTAMPRQLIFCREGKRAANSYIYPPLKLLLVVTHADSALILPPQPLPASEFPELLEPYRQQLEEAFDRYIRDLCERAASRANVFQANAKSRYATSVYSRFVSPASATAAAASTSSTSVEPQLAVKGAADDAEAARAAGAAAAGETREAAATAGASAAASGVSSREDASVPRADSGGTAAGAADGKGTTGGSAAAASSAASSAATNKAEESVGTAGAAASTSAAASRTGAAAAAAAFAPSPCPERICHFLSGGEARGDSHANKTQDPGPFAKLTAVVSARRMNVDSCWALAWTEVWEIYFSLRTRRLAVEGDIRLHSHSCEDWNAQVIYRRRFCNGKNSSLSTAAVSSDSAAAAVSPPSHSSFSPAAAAPAAATPSAAAPPSSAALVSPASAAVVSSSAAPVSSSAAPGAWEETAETETEEGEGLYLKCCEEVTDPAALTRAIVDFIQRKHREVVKEQAFFKHSFTPLMLKRLRRVLSLTGERFDWQQQQIHLQPRQQL